MFNDAVEMFVQMSSSLHNAEALPYVEHELYFPGI